VAAGSEPDRKPGIYEQNEGIYEQVATSSYRPGRSPLR
jgi:hypothetical protein